ncbi:hypothetical protein COJ21_24385 [Priestia megaterium]|nr:hypothetical protein COJ21_24385 [Priestia megaterium]
MKNILTFLIPMLLVFFFLSSQIFEKDIRAFALAGLISIVIGAIIGLILSFFFRLISKTLKKNLHL